MSAPIARVHPVTDHPWPRELLKRSFADGISITVIDEGQRAIVDLGFFDGPRTFAFAPEAAFLLAQALLTYVARQTARTQAP